MIRSVRSLEHCQPLARLVKRVSQSRHGIALCRYLRRFHGAGLNRVPRRFIAYALSLRRCVFGVQLQQPSRKDIRLLFRTDDFDLFLKLRQGKRRPFHLRFQLVELFLHEGRKIGRRPNANVVRVFKIRLCDCIGYIRCHLRVRRTVGDQQQVSVCRASDLESSQGYRCIRTPLRLFHGQTLLSPTVEQMKLLGHGSKNGVGLNELDLSGEELVRIAVVGRTR